MAKRKGSSSGRPPKGRASQSESEGVPRLKSAADRLLLNEVQRLEGNSVLAVLLYGTTLASGLRTTLPGRSFAFYTPEVFFLQTLQEFHPDCTSSEESLDDQPVVVWSTEALGNNSGEVRLICSPDLPEREFDAAVMPTNPVSSSEQTQEYLQEAHQRLRIGGQMMASTSNADDKWLHEQLKELYGRVTAIREKHGVVYLAVKKQPLKKVRDFHSSSAFRFGGTLVHIKTRPGVFSHRKVDGGARALIRTLSPPAADADAESETTAAVDLWTGEKDPARIVDLGCGSGAVSLAAALRYPRAEVLAVDSHARAIECTQQNAAANGITNVDVMLAADADIPEPGTWDLVLTNPPYYSDFRISELFLQAAHTALRRKGQIRVVTKLTDWHVPRMEELFANVQSQVVGEYTVISGTRK